MDFDFRKQFEKATQNMKKMKENAKEKAREALGVAYVGAVMVEVQVYMAFLRAKEAISPSFETLIEKGDAKRVDEMLTKNPALANQLFDAREQLSPLHSAAYSGHADVAAVLLRHGARLDAETHQGVTPLMIASAQGNLPMIGIFVANNDPTLNKLVYQGTKTALMAAAEGGKTDAVKLLHQSGARLDITTSHGMCALLEVNDSLKYRRDAGADHRKTLDYLKQNAGELMEGMAKAGNVYTALMRAARDGDIDIVRAMLDQDKAGAVNNVCAGDRLVRPVHGETETERSVTTALTEAVIKATQSRSLEMVELLLQKGARQDIDYEGDETPLMYAASRKNPVLVKILLDNDTSTINNLHLRIYEGFLDAKRVDFTHSALTMAIEAKDAVSVDLLLKAGARQDLATTKTPMQMAREAGLDDVVEMLKAHQPLRKSPRGPKGPKR